MRTAWLILNVGSNCTRTGHLCEGYASKVPCQKNHTRKPPSPPQAREQRDREPTEVYHRCPGRNQSSIPHCASTHSNDQLYPDASVDSRLMSAQAQPIVVEEHECRSLPPISWRSRWSEPARFSLTGRCRTDMLYLHHWYPLHDQASVKCTTIRSSASAGPPITRLHNIVGSVGTRLRRVSAQLT